MNSQQMNKLLETVDIGFSALKAIDELESLCSVFDMDWSSKEESATLKSAKEHFRAALIDLNRLKRRNNDPDEIE